MSILKFKDLQMLKGFDWSQWLPKAESSRLQSAANKDLMQWMRAVQRRKGRSDVCTDTYFLRVKLSEAQALAIQVKLLCCRMLSLASHFCKGGRERCSKPVNTSQSLKGIPESCLNLVIDGSIRLFLHSFHLQRFKIGVYNLCRGPVVELCSFCTNQTLKRAQQL